MQPIEDADHKIVGLFYHGEQQERQWPFAIYMDDYHYHEYRTVVITLAQVHMAWLFDNSSMELCTKDAYFIY